MNNISIRNHLSEAVVALDNGFRVVYANQQAADFLGFASSEELIGSNLVERLCSDDHSLIKSTCDSSDQDGPPPPLSFRHSDGSIVLADLSCAEIEHEDLKLLVVTLRDYALAHIIEAEYQTLHNGFCRAHVPIALTNAKGEIVFANDAFRATFSVPKPFHGNISSLFTSFGHGWREKLYEKGVIRTLENVGQKTYLIQIDRIESESMLVVCTHVPASERSVAPASNGVSELRSKIAAQVVAGPEDLGKVTLITNSIMLKNFITNQFKKENIRYTFCSGQQALEQDLHSFPGPGFIIYAQPVIGDGEMDEIQRIIRQHQNSKLLVVSFTIDEQRELDAIQAGARGLIKSEKNFAHLALALYAIHNGEYWCPRSIMEKFLSLNKSAIKNVKIGTRQRFGLTKRELEVLKLLTHNRSNKDIANALGVAYTTIVTHVYNIFRKLNVHNRYEAIQVSHDNDLVRTD